MDNYYDDKLQDTTINNAIKPDYHEEISDAALNYRETEGDPVTGYRYDNFFNIYSKKAVVNGYPIGTPHYIQLNPADLGRIQRIDHNQNPVTAKKNPDLREEFYVAERVGHYIEEVPQHIGENPDDPEYNYDTIINNSLGIKKKRVIKGPIFSGATTQINPTNDEEKQAILDSGTLSNYIENVNREKELGTYLKPPISPVHPFYRLGDIDDQHIAHEAIFNTYNRTKHPIADIEWRKGFRHIFITRPECYLTYSDGGAVSLCDQAAYDEDFNSAYTRMPHIVKLLSPWYVSGSFPKKAEVQSNWNFLLSNRVMGLSVAPTTMSYNENVSKSIEGFTVTPAMHVESRQGSTIDLVFKDTKTLEVFETARLWMLYMYKRKKGIFSPPYNGYQKTNGYITDIGGPVAFGTGPDGEAITNDPKYTRFHPYDRALEYCASLYDIITNETGTKILYWCKYYGIYPTSVTPSLSNENNGPITDMTTNITFKYHYRLENVNKTLMEFNHDAGLVDDVGKVKSNITSDSLSFLLRDSYGEHPDPVMPKYIGAAGMFTGSPYVVMQLSQPDPLNKEKMIAVPNLRFMDIIDNSLDGILNMGINNVSTTKSTSSAVGYR